MFPAKIATNSDKKRNFEQVFQRLQTDFAIEKRLFIVETKISIAYCDALFEAGILQRLEAERIKNGLQTILKRADFDKNYFDKTEAADIYQFIDEKLYNLIGELGEKIRIGRNLDERRFTALRFWLREEIVFVSKTLREIQEIFVEFAEQEKETIFFIENDSTPVLFAHWCLAKFEIFQNDRERLDEVWRRTNVLTLGSNRGTGTSLEYDREELAHKLGFQGISTNSLESFGNRDFISEFTNAYSLITIHLQTLNFELSENLHSGKMYFEAGIDNSHTHIISSKLKKMFGFQAEINAEFHPSSNTQTNLETIFAIADLLRNCLQVYEILLQNVYLDAEILTETRRNYLPEIAEIADYLVQRNENLSGANENALKIYQFLSMNKNADLEDLQQISEAVEPDFFDEMSLPKIINSKNQIGGTSYERVSEALEDARKTLQYEE